MALKRKLRKLGLLGGTPQEVTPVTVSETTEVSFNPKGQDIPVKTVTLVELEEPVKKETKTRSKSIPRVNKE
jgi:hypothetical protein